METPFDKLLHELDYHYYDRDSWVHRDQRRGFILDFENAIRADYRDVIAAGNGLLESLKLIPLPTQTNFDCPVIYEVGKDRALKIKEAADKFDAALAALKGEK